MSVSVGTRFNKPVHTKLSGCDELIIPYAKVGIEVEVEQSQHRQMDDVRLQLWESHVDHSLRNNGMEFTTIGGMVGQQIVDAIRDLCSALAEWKCSVGFPRAGIHLHVDVTDMNEKSNTQLLNMVLAYMLFERAVFSYAGNWRAACGFCDPMYMSQQDFHNIGKLLCNWDNPRMLDERDFSKYQAINFLPMQRFGTIEFRQLPTTLDADRILEWINICLSFKNFGMEVDKNPLKILNEQSLTSLAKLVFGKAYKYMAPHIVQEEVMSSYADVQGLLSLSKPVLSDDPWTEPDNPLLLMKAPRPSRRTARAQAIPAAPIRDELTVPVPPPPPRGPRPIHGPETVGFNEQQLRLLDAAFMNRNPAADAGLNVFRQAVARVREVN